MLSTSIARKPRHCSTGSKTLVLRVTAPLIARRFTMPSQNVILRCGHYSAAVDGCSAPTAVTLRDRHVQTIAKHGRTSCLRSSGYSRRSLVETAMYRYKTIVGRAACKTLRPRNPQAVRRRVLIVCGTTPSRELAENAFRIPQLRHLDPSQGALALFTLMHRPLFIVAVAWSRMMARNEVLLQSRCKLADIAKAVDRRHLAG